MATPVEILQIVAFLDHLSAGLIMPQLPPHAARSLGCNHMQIGLMMALYGAFQLASGPIAKTWGEIKGRQTLLVLTISLCGIAYVLLGVTSSIFLFLTLRAFIGFFKHTQMLTKSLAPSFESDKKQMPELMKRLNLLSSGGLAVGPIIGGHIVGTFPAYGFTIVAFTVGAIYAVNSALIRKLPTEAVKEKSKEKTDELPIVPRLIASLSNSFQESLNQFIKVDWVAHREVFLLRLLLLFCTGIFFCNFALYLRIKHLASSENLGYIGSMLTITGILFTRYMPDVNKVYENDKNFTMRTYHAFLTLALAFTGMAFAPSISIYVTCLVPFVVSNILGRSVTSQLISSKVDESQKETFLDVSNNLMTLSGILSPLIAGVLGQTIGILYIIYVCILLAAYGAYRSQKLIPELIVKTDSKNKSE